MVGRHVSFAASVTFCIVGCDAGGKPIKVMCSSYIT